MGDALRMELPTVAETPEAARVRPAVVVPEWSNLCGELCEVVGDRRQRGNAHRTTRKHRHTLAAIGAIEVGAVVVDITRCVEVADDPPVLVDRFAARPRGAVVGTTTAAASHCTC